ncbi:flagellar basal body rod protein FlgB [Pseudoxanthomonas broegbernensis]|uniref:Flagellar basal body rod protein FlgB n=1 Tax=Pseudoxanthomonas broegbernensis TaxID=83619 RepID=A0A7V8GL66_9GAMM|nr:flagellar basal body rod protein FlgB [Pseudoxanthomonas broegbernensis]KAF1685578.1 flagellar basal body rod protein FlgB [Pseudoxanthomonas broegbernensis]MBB6065950.1 flagellar basal-body rod protein FlgB [Pseudoxanthomonas broegbernensis]
MSNPISSYFGVHADALPLREQRMKLIASNLANADTPGYKAQDIDFNAALDSARQQRMGLQDGNGMATTNERHLSDAIDTGRLPFQFTRQASQPSLDGNTVDPDAERAAYGRAALEYRASLSFLESKVRNMLTAITGQ